MAQRLSACPVSTFFFKPLLLKNHYYSQIQPKLVGNMRGGWGFVQIKGLALSAAQLVVK